MNIALATLGLSVCLSTAFAQSIVWSDAFDDNDPIGWTYAMRGWIAETNQQFVVSGNFGAAQTNNPLAAHDGGGHSIPNSGPLPDNQTLELRADLVGASQNDAWAGIDFLWQPEMHGYLFFKDQDEVALVKFWNGATSLAYFFYENLPLKNQNVTLVLALTRLGSNVKITTRVLDKDNANAVLFERAVTDTPAADSGLPNRAVRGMIGMADLPGTPWPAVKAPTDVGLTLTWINSQAAPQPPAQVTYDNLEVWQYETPQLAIQRAVVLSWPAAQRLFWVVSAPSVDGPWAPLPAPWVRTNETQIEVSVEAADSAQFFRLRFEPQP